MKEIRTGNLVVRAVQNSFQFEVSGKDTGSAVVPIEDIALLLNFFQKQVDSNEHRRAGFRLDLSELESEEVSRLQVTVEIDGKTVPVKPLDISISGIRVESDQIAATIGAKARLEVGFEDFRVTLPAVLVRVFNADRCFAFHFTEIFGEDGRLDPPNEFTEIYYALQSIWLNQNLDLKWNLA